MGSIVVPGPLYMEKFYVEEYSKLTGIAQTTFYTAFEDSNVSLMYVIFKHDNTDNMAKEMSFKLTVDDEVFLINNSSIDDNTVYFFSTAYPSTIGARPQLNLTAYACFVFGLTDELAGSGAGYADTKLSGHNIKIEYEFDDVPGTAEKFYMDLYYTKKESV